MQRPSGRFHVKPGGAPCLFVYDPKEVVLAHGARASLLSLNRWNWKGPGGVHSVQAIIKAGQKSGGADGRT